MGHEHEDFPTRAATQLLPSSRGSLFVAHRDDEQRCFLSPFLTPAERPQVLCLAGKDHSNRLAELRRRGWLGSQYWVARRMRASS